MMVIFGILIAVNNFHLKTKKKKNVLVCLYTPQLLLFAIQPQGHSFLLKAQVMNIYFYF